MSSTALQPRSVTFPNQSIDVGGNPDLDRCFIKREVLDWALRPHILPRDFSFTEQDKTLGRASLEAWEEMQFKGPIHCNDVWVLRKNENGNCEALTIVRRDWPLNGERWMMGGREVTPPGDHPLADKWLQEHSLLLMLYREVGIQPNDIQQAFVLLDAQLTFKHPDDPTKMKQTPATLWAIEVSPDTKIALDKKESADALWVDLDQLTRERMTELKMCEYVRYGLQKIKSRLPLITKRPQPDPFRDLKFPGNTHLDEQSS